MSSIIKRSDAVRGLVRRMGVLPLLPTEKILKGFLSIAKECRKKGVMRYMLGLLKYWLRTWRPKIPVLSVSGCSDRTSNGSEVDNRMLQEAMRQKSPNVWDFMGESLHHCRFS